MCGRYTLRLTPAQLQATFDLLRAPEFAPRFNIAPTQTVVTISQDDDGVRAAVLRGWGLIPSWAKDPKIGSQMINARSEEAAGKPAFRAAMKRRRCLIPASGYYEWQQVAPRVKQPWLFTRKSGEPLVFAGLWERWQPEGAEAKETCTILTTSANASLSDLHHRMPVLLPREHWNVWLDRALTDAAALQPLLVPWPDDDIQRTAVSPPVNHVRNDDEACIEPIGRPAELF